MISPSIKLFRLRGIFVAYYVLKSLVGAVVAWSLLQPMVDWHFDRPGWSISSLTIFSLMAAGVILVIAWLIFNQLLLRKNWARVLLLVIGWLTVASAIFSLLASTHLGDTGAWIVRLAPEMDWERLMNFDRVQKVFGLLFWGYLISVLQFDPELKAEFFRSSPSSQDGEPS